MRKLNLKRIDPELVPLVKTINTLGKTVASCSGHGKYHRTIIIEVNGKYYDYDSGLIIQPMKRRYLCFYQRDRQGVYFIPQVEDFYKNQELEREAI